MNTKDFAEKYIKAEEDSFQKGDFSALAKLEDADVVYHIPPLPDMRGHEAHKQDIMGTRQAATELHQEFKYLAGDGNVFALAYKSSARMIAEKPGFPIPIGKKIAGDYIFVYRLEKGKVKEAWANGSFAISD